MHRKRIGVHRRSGMPRDARSGLAMLEFAMVLPIFALMMIGIIEFGRAFQVAQQLTVAAREGGRLGLLQIVDDSGNETNNEKVVRDIKNFLAAGGIPINNAQVLIMDQSEDDPYSAPELDLEDADRDTYFRVHVSVPFNDVAYNSPWFLGGRRLSGSVVFRHE
ncbi:Pilus assembly protein [Planctomycetales bacterium 10988]|nr:Pilus assembly protein [Planctomycetales bacterium 10988]